MRLWRDTEVRGGGLLLTGKARSRVLLPAVVEEDRTSRNFLMNYSDIAMTELAS